MDKDTVQVGQSVTDIVERLRRTQNVIPPGGKPLYKPINPDGPEAADIIEAQRKALFALVDAMPARTLLTTDELRPYDEALSLLGDKP